MSRERGGPAAAPASQPRRRACRPAAGLLAFAHADRIASRTLAAVAVALGWLQIAPAPATAQAEIAIGLAGPMTGRYASFGTAMREGAEAAVADINAAGGVSGARLRLVVEDDACDAQAAAAAAARLAARSVRLVVGHHCPSASIAAAKVYARDGVIQITPSTTHPRLTDERAGPGIFRLAGRDDMQGAVAGRDLAIRFAGAGIAILHDRTAYGIGLAEGVRRELRKANAREVLFEHIIPGEKDYGAVIARLARLEPKALFLGGFPTEAALLVRLMRERRLETTLIAGDALADPQFWQIAGPAGEGTLVTAPGDFDAATADRNAVARLEARGLRPGALLLASYAAVEIWAGAARNAASTDPGPIAEAIAGAGWPTVLGTVTFDRKGDADRPSHAIHRWTNGRLEPLR